MTKITSSTLLDDLFEGRSLEHISSDDLVHYTNLAMNAYRRYEELNAAAPAAQADVPK